MGVTRTKFFVKNLGGFTLLELLVTIAIIGILSTLAAFASNIARERAKIEKAKADLDQINIAINLLVNDTGEWPNHQQVEYVCVGCLNNELCNDNPGCTASFSSSKGGISATDGNFNGWNGPYIQTMPLDPWGNEYFFDTDYDIGGGEWRAVIGTYGPNGKGLNDYDSDDIVRIIGFDQ